MKMNMQAIEEILVELQEELENERLIEAKETLLHSLQGEMFSDVLSKEQRNPLEKSARVLHHWAKEGLIDEVNKEKGRLRLFNLTDTIWLRIIDELRDFGMPITAIKKLRESLFNKSVPKFSPLEYFIVHSVVYEPITLLVYADGNCSCISLDSYLKKSQFEFIKAHIRIDLSLLLRNEYPHHNFDSVFPKMDLEGLSEKELGIIYLLRTGDFETIQIRMDDSGEAFLLQGTKVEKQAKKFVDILRENKYMDLQIVQRGGRTVKINRTELIKL